MLETLKNPKLSKTEKQEVVEEIKKTLDFIRSYLAEG